MKISRRLFGESAFRATVAMFFSSSIAVAARTEAHAGLLTANSSSPELAKQTLQQVEYADVQLATSTQMKQFQHCIDTLMNLDDDAMLRPFRLAAGLPAPGADIGGWYAFNPQYDPKIKGSAGFAPGHCFGQWVSALARAYATTKDENYKSKVTRLLNKYSETIGDRFFEDTRFPAYTFDKLVCALIDAYEFADYKDAPVVLQRLTKTALSHLPAQAVARDVEWNKQHPGDNTFTWDESYTLPENLYLAFERGLGDQYKALAHRYLDDAFFEKLAAGSDALSGKHAYSYTNALSSAMLAYVVEGSELHFQAAKKAFEMIVSQQSYATGGWGPDERFRAPTSGELGESLSLTHNSFETPCGSYAHFKLGRYLLCSSGDGKYGDSMERVMYNTCLGALPLAIPGKAFYYSDNNMNGKKVYHGDPCPCCAGTLPQVASDYGINSYFKDKAGLWVNLYIPSQIRWSGAGGALKLTVRSEYPYDDLVRITIGTEAPTVCSLRLRIPGWVNESWSVAVNNHSVRTSIENGFITLHREWKPNDTIDLKLPMLLRLEQVDEQHPHLVALMRGPLVLFAIDGVHAQFTKQSLLTARPNGKRQWLVGSGHEVVQFRSFEDITTETYSTYVQLDKAEQSAG